MNRTGFVWIAVALLLSAWNGQAFADGCDDCGEPSVSDIQGEVGFTLYKRLTGNPAPLPPFETDYVEIDAGECSSTQVDKPEVTKLNAFLALRGKGEVWDCPHSMSSDTIVAQTSESDSTGWEISGTVEMKLKAPAAEFKAAFTQGKSGGSTIEEVNRVEKQITAGWCRRVPWKAYFEIADFQVEGTFAYKQRFAWWIKNAATGSDVHAKGSVYKACGTATFTLQRRAPISAYTHITPKRCQSPECAAVPLEDAGFYPPLPPYLKEPEEPPFPWGDDDEDETAPVQPPK